jgi:hypothetical protein
MISFTATGDSLIREHFPQKFKDREKITRFISKGDVRITNLETTLTRFQYFGNTFCGGAWITSPPNIMQDLLEFGFNMFSCANNHSMDFAYDGLLATMEELQALDVDYCGIGKSLAEASQPAFVQTPNGRVAVLSQAALYEHQYGARAGDPHDGFPPRPGINLLRRECEIQLDAEHFKVIEQIAEKVGLEPKIDGSYNFDNRHVFKPGAKTRRFSRVNETDMLRMENYIKASRYVSASTVVYFHAHANKNISPYLEEVLPDYYIEEYAHRCIDAGADAVIGSGCHRLRGIEIYKGRPIFYSLGNFIFHSARYAYRVPADYADMFDVDETLVGPLAIASKQTTDATLEVMDCYYRSMIPYWEIEDGKVTKIEILPIQLEMTDISGLKGFPSCTSPVPVLKDLTDASEAYGTTFYEKDGLIHVNLSET